MNNSITIKASDMHNEKMKYTVMTARYNGTCAHCNKGIEAQSRIVYDTETKQTYHTDCGRERYHQYWSTLLYTATVAINQIKFQ